MGFFLLRSLLVQIGLDGGTAEGGEVRGVLEDVLVRDHGELGVIHVQPVGDLAVGDEEDFPYPGCILLHRAERVTELLVVRIPVRPGKELMLGRRKKSSRITVKKRQKIK